MRSSPRSVPAALVVCELVSRQNTEFMVAGTAPIFEYVYTHIGVPVTAGEKYFIEIQNDTPDADMDGVGDTTWFWEWADAGSSPNANGIGYQAGDDGTTPVVGDPGTYARFERDVNDYAFCLNIVTAAQDTVCNLPDPTPCELDLTGSTDTEPEFCNEDPDQNLGCSADVGFETFTDIVVSTDPTSPTLIQGISWADGGARDIDWYRMTAPAASDVDGDLTVTVCTASLRSFRWRRCSSSKMSPTACAVRRRRSVRMRSASTVLLPSPSATP